MASLANRIQAAVLVMACCFPAAAGARVSDRISDPFRTKKEKFELITFTMKRWFSIGRDAYATSYTVLPAFIQPAGTELRYGTGYEFTRSDASMNLFALEVRPWSRLSFDFQYAGKRLRDGHAVEHDFVDTDAGALVTFSPSGTTVYSPKGTDFGRKEIEQRGKTEWMTASAYIRVLKTKSDPFTEWNYTQNLDVLVGWDRYSDEYQLVNANQTVSSAFAATQPAPGMVAGFDNRFRFLWQGARFGVREVAVSDMGISATIVLAYSPIQFYRGRGFSNLSTTLRTAAPNFQQYADGSIFDGSLQFSYAPVKVFSFDMGWNFLYLWARNGHQVDLLANGNHGDQRLDYARSQRIGWFTGASLHF